jgi:hypothetical protein
MKMRSVAAALAISLLPITSGSMARAEDDPLTVQARTRFKEGVKAFDKQRYEEARVAFLQAYTLKKHPAVLLNLAQSSAKANRPLEAAKYFQQFLAEATTATEAQRKDAETGLSEVRQKLGRIEILAPAGSEIFLDDLGKVGTAPMPPIDVDPGEHTVRSNTQKVIVSTSAGQKVDADLMPPPAPSVAVVPVPVPAGTTAPPPSPPASSPAQPAQPTSPEGPRPGLFAPPANITPAAVGLGTAVVGVASAIVFAVFKSDAQRKADAGAASIRVAANKLNVSPTGACSANVPQLTDACSVLQENNARVDTNAMIANISLGVAGAGLLFAGVWYLAAPKRQPNATSPATTPDAPRAMTWTPWANVDGAGMSFASTF